MINLGLGEFKISNDANETIVTHALGTCVAFIVYCPITKTAAMAHIVLPSRHNRQHRNIKREAYFADDIVPRIIEHYLSNSYCRKSRLKVLLVGGAVSRNPDDFFKVGELNVTSIQSLLKSYGIAYDYEETGGRYSRTVKIEVATGLVNIKRQEMLL